MLANFERVTLLRESAKTLSDESAGCRDLFTFLERFTDQIRQIVKRQRAVDFPFVPSFLHERLFLVKLVLDLSHEFFEDVLQSHDAERSAVLIDNDGKV